MLAMSDAVFVSVFLFFISSLDLFWRSYLKDSSKLREGKIIQKKNESNEVDGKMGGERDKSEKELNIHLLAKRY